MITADLDVEEIDLERIGAPEISRRIKIANLRGDIAFEATRAEQQAGERKQKV